MASAFVCLFYLRLLFFSLCCRLLKRPIGDEKTKKKKAIVETTTLSVPPLSTLGSQTRDGIKKKKKKTTQNSTPAKNTIKIKKPSVYIDIYIHQSMTEKRKKKCVQFRFPRSHCNALFFFFLSSESLFTQPIKTGFAFPLAPQCVGKKKKAASFYTRHSIHIHTHKHTRTHTRAVAFNQSRSPLWCSACRPHRWC